MASEYRSLYYRWDGVGLGKDVGPEQVGMIL